MKAGVNMHEIDESTKDVHVVNSSEQRPFGPLPPIELFSTTSGYYVFDSQILAFMEVSKPVFEVLKVAKARFSSPELIMRDLGHFEHAMLNNALKEIRRAQSRGFLNFVTNSVANKHQWETHRELLNRHLKGLTLLVTTECNLACSYCIYGGHYVKHSALDKKRMSPSVMKASMDFLAKHSVESEEIQIDFFGGEPLLAFQTIRNGVKYLQSIIPTKKIQLVFTIATNGTIMTQEIIDFLVGNGVFIQFSIDGDKHCHDNHRTYKNGTGTYEDVIRNLRYIRSVSSDYYRNNVRIKAVITSQNMNLPDSAFLKEPLIREQMELGHLSFVDLEPFNDVERDSDYIFRLNTLGNILLNLRSIESETQLQSKLSHRFWALYGQNFHRFFGMQAAVVSPSERNGIPFVKSCVLGARHATVSPEGEVHVCIRARNGNNFMIGDVQQGDWQFDKIAALYRRLYEPWKECDGCFLRRACEFCCEVLDGREGKWEESRHQFCRFNRKKHRTIFRYMLDFMENNPAMWNYLEDLAVQHNCPLLNQRRCFGGQRERMIGATKCRQNQDGSASRTHKCSTDVSKP